MAIDDYFLKGKIAIAQGRFKEAMDAFDNALYGLKSAYPELLLWAAYSDFLYAEYELAKKTDKNEKAKRIAQCVIKLEAARRLSVEEKKQNNNEYNNSLSVYLLYFLGYVYYRTGDYFSSKQRLIECINISIGDNDLDKDAIQIKQESRELFNYVWERTLNPSFWRWWLFSPVNTDEKRLVFVGIVGLIIWTFFSLNLCLPLAHLIDIDGTTLQLAFIIMLLVILFIPSLQRIKAREIEIEMKIPPTIIISPAKFNSTLSQNLHMPTNIKKPQNN
jgi:tetratricopeptide (TPR) repeat protein